MSNISATDLRNAVSKMKQPIKFETNVLEKCVALCNRSSSMDVADFLDHLEAFLLNQDSEILGTAHLGKLESYMIKESSVKIKNTVVTPSSSMPKNSVKAPMSTLETSSLGKRSISDSYVTPSSQEIKSQQPTSGSSSSSVTKTLESSFSQASGIDFSQRKTKDQMVMELHPELGMRGSFEPSDVKPLGTRCQLKCNKEDFDNIDQRYRYMFTTLDERAKSLDVHLLRLQEQMCAMANILTSSLQPVGIPSQDTVWVCGRICCEAAEGRINKSSIVLEGSRRDSAGRKVHLELLDIPAYSLFPGQIVLVEGVNSSGRLMIAKRIIEGIRKPIEKTLSSKLLEYHHQTLYQGGNPLSVITAAGPFTTSNNLDYDPLRELLLMVLKKKPDVLILIGPFVDISQPLLASGNVELKGEDGSSHCASYEAVFVKRIVTENLKEFFEAEEVFKVNPTQVILVPSLLDAHHEFVFPQPPFGDREKIVTPYFEEALGELKIPFSDETKPKRRVHLLPNPCMFRVNETLFAVCSNDVLFGLSSDEVSAGTEGNRLARLSAHILQQQSFCPQFPVPSNSLSQFDLRHSKHWEFKNTPDVLILPSRLTLMCKEVMGTLVLNPGQLTKGIGGGTYAEMAIHPIKESELRDTIIEANGGSIVSAASSSVTGGVTSTGGAGAGQPQRRRAYVKDGSGQVLIENGVGARTSVIIRKI